MLLFFPSGFLCAFLFVFSLLFGLFLGSNLALVLGACCSFSVWLLCAFLFVFSLLSGFFQLLAATKKKEQRLMTADGGADYRGGKGL